MYVPIEFEILNKDIVENFINKNGFATSIVKTVKEP